MAKYESLRAFGFKGSFARLVHAECLEATGNREGARKAIAVARERLLRIAEKVGAPEYRRSFLEEVPENRRTLELARPPPSSILMGVMWNDEKSQRFDDLRREQARRALTETEQAELAALFAEIDAEEAQALRPALDRLAREADALRADKAQVEARTRDLERIVEQQERLLAEARTYAERLRQRRNALADEFQRIRTSTAEAAR